MFSVQEAILPCNPTFPFQRNQISNCAMQFTTFVGAFHKDDTYQYDALIGDGRAGVEAPSCERGVHVRTCRCTPHLTCVSVLSNGSLAAHQVQTQSAQQVARYGKRVCTCARADATHPDLCKARIYWAPSHTQNLNAILPAVCEIWKRGVHVRTC